MQQRGCEGVLHQRIHLVKESGVEGLTAALIAFMLYMGFSIKGLVRAALSASW